MQHIPNVTQADVERVIRRDFSTEDPATVFAILREYDGGGSERTGNHHRVHLAALKRADGDLQELRAHIQIANQDYRDVLAAAEYPKAFQRWPAMDATSDEGWQVIYDEDWEQYQAWLQHP